MAVKTHKWILPSKEDGESFIVRTQAAEKDLCSALDLLQHVKGSIPHKPAGEVKEIIDNFLAKFK